MTNKRYTYIPQRMKSVNKEDPYVTGAEDIDAGNGKSQQVKNTEVDETLTQLSNEIDAVNKQDVIPVDTLPAVATADPKKIYRVVGEDSYTDYMVNATGDGWKELATYSFPGIDDEPTVGSDNPAKSGGIANMYGSYIESPEFVRVVLDNEKKVLYGVQKDGNFYFGAGCPQQVKDYVQQKIDTIMGVGDITEKIDTINEMIAFFDEISHDTTLKELLAASAQAVAEEKTRAEAAEQHLDEVKANKEEVNAALNTKVDKEEGKSLINSEFAEGVHYIESPEFAEIKLDAEERIVEATYKDGTKLLPAGVKIGGVAEYDGATVTTISNPEFVAIWLDSSYRILLGIRNDADIFFGYGVPSQIKDYIDANLPESMQKIVAFIGEYLGSITLQELLDKKVDGEYIESPEYIEAKLDSEDKVVEATRKDGTKVLPAGVETPKVNLEGATIENSTNPEYIEAKVDTEDKLLEGFKTDGTKVIGGNLEVGNELKVKGDVEVDGNVSYKNGIPQAIVDYVAANTGSGVSNIEYEDETGDMYATYNEADGVTDVYMEENGDIYAEIEE